MVKANNNRISQKEFDELIKISYNKNNTNLSDYYSYKNKVYFNSRYFCELKQNIFNSNIYYENKEPKRELKSDKYGLAKIRSVASSARLTFMYFYNKNNKNIVLEYPRKNGVHGSSYFDAYDNCKNIFYECKCHEICKKSGHDKFSIAYKNKLEDLFGISINDINAKKQLQITLKDFGVKTETKGMIESASIYNIHLDVKQLICHLIAIQNNNIDSKVKTLKYIFFVPDEYKNKNNLKISSLYNCLKNEWNMICNSNAIKLFLKKEQNIKISEPEFVLCSTINDCIKA